MKKLVLIVALLVGISAQAVTVQQHVRAGEMTNLIATTSGKISQFILTTAANDAGYVWFIDAPDKNYRYTNSLYYTYTKYATNDIVVWTNFFGATNYTTNIVLKVQTNTVAAATNNLYPIVFTSRVGTNTTMLIDGSYLFYRGLTVTNAGSGGVNITVTYENR